MSKVAIITDTNSGIMPAEGEALGIKVIPTPFMIDGVEFLEGINLTQEDFFKKLADGADVSTSQPFERHFEPTVLWHRLFPANGRRRAVSAMCFCQIPADR